MGVLALTKILKGYSFKRLLINYRRSCLRIMRATKRYDGSFTHPYFSQLTLQYVESLANCDQVQLLAEADALVKVPYLDISAKKWAPLEISHQNYLSFAPYYWQECNDNPLKKSSIKAVYRDGRANPFLAARSDKPKLAQMCARIHLLTLATIKHNNPKYLEYIGKQLSIWFIDEQTRMFPQMKYAQIIPWSGAQTGFGIIDSRWLILLLDALAMLTHHTDFQVDDTISRWFNDFAIWILTSTSGLNEIMRENNRGSWVDVLLCYIGLALNKPEMANVIINQTFSNRTKKQVDEFGFQPYELKRFNPISYSLYNMYPLYYLNCISRFTNDQFMSNAHIDRLQRIENDLLKYIKGSEKGKIEHINFNSSFGLNLYYPYSHAQLKNFPCVLPFTDFH